MVAVVGEASAVVADADRVLGFGGVRGVMDVVALFVC